MGENRQERINIARERLEMLDLILDLKIIEKKIHDLKIERKQIKDKIGKMAAKTTTRVEGPNFYFQEIGERHLYNMVEG